MDPEEEAQRRAGRWISCDVEEHYLGEDRKAGRVARKRASKQDRSKFKKTDQDKIVKRRRAEEETLATAEHLHRGRVLSISSAGMEVDAEGKRWLCSIRGALKKDKRRLKNLVTVGDFVRFEVVSEHEGSIVHVDPRKTILSRADPLSQQREQLLAANIDQVLITMSVVIPPLKPSLMDRYIIATQKGGMDPVLLINKIDLLEGHDDEQQLFKGVLQAYREAEIPVVPISVVTGEGLEQLRQVMKDKASVFSGPSGVGKSSLINAVASLTLPVGEPVEKTRKGAHTTTTAHLLRLEFGGWCIDTPGIKSFGVWDLEREEIEPYFNEFAPYRSECRYPNCSHTVEEECAVKRAVDSGALSVIRYESYLSLVASASEKHLRR